MRTCCGCKLWQLTQPRYCSRPASPATGGTAVAVGSTVGGGVGVGAGSGVSLGTGVAVASATVG